MHELSIALSIIEMAEEESAQRGGARVHAVHLRLGRLSGVVKSALESAYELAIEGTALEGAHLVVEEVSIAAKCPKCQVNREVTTIEWFVCSECGSALSEVVRGRELEVVALRMQEWEVTP